MLVRSRDLSARPMALRRICLISSSIERPLLAALTHRRIRTSSSRFRIVMLAMCCVSLRGKNAGLVLALQAWSRWALSGKGSPIQASLSCS